MSQPLPGLSGLDKAGLQAAYLAEIGTEAGEQTVDQLRDALKAHRETQPPVAAQGPLPGSVEFDVDNASPADYDKHVEILRRRAEVAGLTPTPLVAVSGETVAAPVAGPPEITKYSKLTGNPISMSAASWALLTPEYAAEFDEAEPEVAKPALAAK